MASAMTSSAGDFDSKVLAGGDRRVDPRSPHSNRNTMTIGSTARVDCAAFSAQTPLAGVAISALHSEQALQTAVRLTPLVGRTIRRVIAEVAREVYRFGAKTHIAAEKCRRYQPRFS
jgi:hypothetical protein